MKFEEILSWQKSQEFAVLLYRLFKTNKDYAFRDQIKRAVVSISNNIAEGFERESKKELIHFLYIAKGSCGEVRSMLYIAHKLSYIPEKELNNNLEQCENISKLIAGFIRKIKKNNNY